MPEYRLIDDIVDPYIRETKNERKISTQKTEACNVKQLVRFFGRDFVSDIKGADVRQYRRSRIEVDKVSPDTVMRELALASKACNYAMIEWEYAISNPFAGRLISDKDRKALRRRPVRKIEIEEQVKILTWCASQQDKFFALFGDIFVFTHETGLRMSEVLNLKWWQLQCDVIQFTPDMQKSNHSSECVMNANALLVVSRRTQSHENVFVYDDAPISRHKIQWAIDKVRKGVGFHFVFSDTRKSRGQHMLDNGHAIDDVKEQLRHETIRTTEKNYLTTPVDRLRRSVAVIDCSVLDKKAVDSF